MQEKRTCGLMILLAGCLMWTGLGTGCVSSPRQQQVERQERAMSHVRQGQEFLELDLTDEALTEFSLALEENPDLVDAHIGVGTVYRRKGDYEQAKVSYSRASQIDPTSFDARYYLGLVNQLTGDLRDAVAVYLQALTINPDSFEANHNLAGAYLQLNQPERALPYARKASELRTDHQAAWSNLAATYSLLRRYREAVDAYRQAVELGEIREPILIGLADAHIRLGNYDRSINVLRTLIRQMPSATAYERLGYAQFKMRRFDDALASFRAALSIDDNDVPSLNGLGVCLMTLYIQGGRSDRPLWEQAIVAWRRSIALQADQPRIVDLLSRYQRL